jgi:uncharacterized YigZ family protein
VSQQSFHYFTIEKSANAEFKDRGSKFIGFAFSISTAEDVKAYLKQVKELHPKANHYCYAYKLGVDNNHYKSSDAGEPKGSAGLPILNQILSKQVTNVLVIVVRYFGGTLLGVPGLINAYKTTASLCLQVTPIVQKVITETFLVTGDYTIVNDVMQIAKRFNCFCRQSSNLLFVELEVEIPLQQKEQVLFVLKDVQGITVTKK